MQNKHFEISLRDILQPDFLAKSYNLSFSSFTPQERFRIAEILLFLKGRGNYEK